jgi:uncharacterized protein YgiB involved in biofilm formation
MKHKKKYENESLSQALLNVAKNILIRAKEKRDEDTKYYTEAVDKAHKALSKAAAAAEAAEVAADAAAAAAVV